MKRHFALLFSTLLLSALPLSAQISHGGAPLFNHSQAKVKAPVQQLSQLDNAKYLQEDLMAVRGAGPMRVGVVQQCHIDVLKEAYCFKDNQGTHYLLSVLSPEASFMNLHFSNFALPEGASLYLYDESGDFVLGRFESGDALDGGQFYTQAIPGSMVQIEYTVPANAEPGSLVLGEVTHGYKDLFGSISQMYDDQAAALKGAYGNAEGNCHINVVCPEGDDWRDQIRSVVALQILGGGYSFMCSGALINNAHQDRTPYVLSAFHCQDLSDYGISNVSNWITYFLYETSSCNNNSGLSNKSVSGADILAKYSYEQGSDFLLLKLKNNVPDAYKPYYAGWDWNTQSSHTPGIAIHHPGGDYKKLSFPKTITAGSGQLNKFYKVYWYTGSSNKGTTEEGSSGSPLFNEDKRIIGQLYAGYSACTYPGGEDYYGRLSVSRKGNNTNASALLPYLDPDSTDIMQLDGLDYKDNTSGITTAGGNSMRDLQVYPNPTSGTVHFDVDAIGQANYKLFDLMGRCVREGRTILGTTAQGLNLGNLPRGSYVLHLHTAAGSYKASIIIK